MKLHFVGEGIVGYRRYMLFKQYLNAISHSKIIQEKLVLIKFFDKWGARATYDAYGVSRLLETDIFLPRQRFVFKICFFIHIQKPVILNGS